MIGDDADQVLEAAQKHFADGQFTEGLRELEKVLQGDHNSLPAFQALRAITERGSLDVAQLEQLKSLATRLKAIVANGSVEANLEFSSILESLDRGAEAVEFLNRAVQLQPEKADLVYRAGQAFRRLKEFERALESFRQAIKADPTLAAAYVDFAQTLAEFQEQKGVIAKVLAALRATGVQRGDPGGVLARAASALLQRSGDAEVEAHWHQIRTAMNDHAKQATWLCEAIERNIDQGLSKRISFDCGNELFSQDLFEQARRLYQRAATDNPQFAPAFYNWGVALARLRRHEEAIERYTSAFNEKKPPKRANPSRGGGEKPRSNYFDARQGRARSLLALQRYEDAGKAFEEALKLGTDFGQSDPDSRRVEIYNDWAFACSEARRYTEALQKSEQALDLKPDDYDALFRLAYTLSDMMRHEEAVARYEEAVRVKPANPYAHHNIAYMLDRQGRYRLARATLRRACRLYRDRLADEVRGRNADFCLNYGDAYREAIEDVEGVEALFRAGLALDPENAPIHVKLGNLYLDKKKRLRNEDAKAQAHWQAFAAYREAERLLERRIEISKDRQTLVELAELHVVMEDFEEAKKEFEEALDMDRDSARTLKGLGELNARTGNHSAAVRCFRESLHGAPDDLTVRAALAQALLKAGSLDEAEAEYQEVLAVTRDHLDAHVGLGEVYLAMAEKVAGERDPVGREDLLTQAMDSFSEAIRRFSSEDRSRTLARNEQASVLYQRGYAMIELYQKSRGARDFHLVRAALNDFQTSAELDPANEKAKRAIRRLASDVLRRQYWLERSAPALIIGFAIAVLFLAQLAIVFGRPVQTTKVALTEQSLITLQTAGVPKGIIERLKGIQGVRYSTVAELLASAEEVVGKKDLAGRKNRLADHASRLRVIEVEQLKPLEYTTITLGALLFIIAGAFLPRLTSLKLPFGLELAKTASEQVETIGTIGIRK